MTATEALARLRAAGVVLRLEEGELHVHAPPGVMTDDRLDWLRANKPALLEALAREVQGGSAGVDGDALGSLYAQLFDGQAARSMVTLESRQVRRAIDCGAIDPLIAAASVIVAYRAPGAGACLIAIPRERFDALAILQTFHDTADPAHRARAGNGSTERA